MLNFQYNLPVNIIFGRGKSALVGCEVLKYGTKALIVTGGNSTKKSGLLENIIKSLMDSGISSVVFDKVTPNPLTTTIYEGAKLFNESHCDVVLGVGGGSAMDAAKSIAFQALNNGDISDYIFGLKQSDVAAPIVLIPTTCGTGSEGNGFSVLSNPDNGDKKSLRCNAIIAKASIIDPDLMKTMPKHILAQVGFDALCHNMEAYISKISSPFTEILALEGIRLIGANLLKVYSNPENDEGWDEITLASTLGGMVIHTAGVTLPHGMEHPASGLRDIVHGNGLSALTPIIIEESITSAPEKFRKISNLLGGRDEFDLVNRINNLINALNLEKGLFNQGIKEEDIDWMVENCLKVSAAAILNHPKNFEKEDIKRIYKKALGKELI